MVHPGSAQRHRAEAAWVMLHGRVVLLAQLLQLLQGLLRVLLEQMLLLLLRVHLRHTTILESRARQGAGSTRGKGRSQGQCRPAARPWVRRGRQERTVRGLAQELPLSPPLSPMPPPQQQGSIPKKLTTRTALRALNQQPAPQGARPLQPRTGRG